MADNSASHSAQISPQDLELLRKVEAGLQITADVSRADILLCTLQDASHAIVNLHAVPNSISSLYKLNATTRVFTAEEQPLLFQALRSGSGGRRQREVPFDGAPIIQDVFPVHTEDGRVIAAMMVETNMIAHERQRRRNRHFRQAVVWMQEMCAGGALESAAGLGPFSLYDGIYLVDTHRSILYMSGIAANLFRSIGIIPEVSAQPLTALEPQDVELVEHVFSTQRADQQRHETDDGRIWVRIAVPLRMPTQHWRTNWLSFPWEWSLGGGGREQTVDAVMVLIHNATEAVQKQRELNVKSAIIQEVHHRVKNNLQNIAAILRIQARRVQNDEARQHINDAVNRVLSMAVIHEFMSHDENRAINVKDVCQRIGTQVQQVSASPDQAIFIQVQGPNVRVPASQATPLAMVINELLLNAVEHGLKGRPDGRINIALDDLGDAVRICIEDDGNGLPPGFDIAQPTSSLGLHIVLTLVTDDLKGRIVMEQRAVDAGDHAIAGEAGPPVETISGTRAVVTFPKRALRS
ncbi:MAG: histidine kinase N-terminal domain-containing protein [Anaerolineales bacterium]|nr:histidine kinase N-terminal domain-containing protein [Anaerolineales bacterium]